MHLVGLLELLKHDARNHKHKKVEPNFKEDSSKEVEPNFKEDSSKVDMKDIIEKLEASAMKKDGMIEKLKVSIWYIIYITVI